jgi:hypothetical protein
MFQCLTTDWFDMDEKSNFLSITVSCHRQKDLES